MRQYIDRLGYRPRTCVWEITLACNASCRHCGSRAGRPRDGELDTAEALRVAGELGALGCERTTLSGGEPLLRRDWPAIAEALVGAGVTVGMISNGLAFDAAEARRAVDAGLANVSFSVDGLEAVHDRMRGRKGSFRRVRAAFEAAAAVGLPTCAVSHVHRGNFDDLDEMHAWLRGLGVRTWKLQLCNPAGEASRHREMILEPRDLLRIVPKIVELRGRGLPYVETSDSIGYYGPYEEAMRRTWRPELAFWTGCYAGCRVIGLESAGNVKGCLALPSERHGTDEFVEGNVRTAGLADLWFRPGAFAYNRSFHPRQLTGFCRTCPYGEICRAGCHWTALAHGGTLRENRFCYYRVSVEAERARSRRRRWIVQGLAPAAIVATLGVGGCYQSYAVWADGGEPADASAATEDADAGPLPMYGPAPADVPESSAEADTFPLMYGPPPADADVPPEPDVPAGWYGPVPDVATEAEVHCPTAEEACCDCDYMDPVPIPPGCPDPCIHAVYGDPTPVPDALVEATADASGEATADAADCPDPCFRHFYGPPPTFPPGCRYECEGTATCPTSEEACCMCDYDGPYPIPPECEDPCE
jgi:radical SAM protein with 4Fe4S-binding SPASM domain